MCQEKTIALVEGGVSQQSDIPTADSKTNKVYTSNSHQHSIYDPPKNDHITKTILKKLFIASIIAFLFLIAEIAGGIISGSLAILSDAAHMFTDLSGFVISIVSVWISQKPASKTLSFGFHRSEVVGAFISIILIWVVTIFLLYEATVRIFEQEAVDNPLIMLATAIFGLFINLIMAKVLHSAPGHHHSGCSHGHKHGNEHNHEHNHDHSHSHKHGHEHNHNHEHELDHNHDKNCGHNHKDHDNIELKENKNHCDGHKHNENHSHNDNIHCHVNHDNENKNCENGSFKCEDGHDHEHHHNKNQHYHGQFIELNREVVRQENDNKKIDIENQRCDDYPANHKDKGSIKINDHNSHAKDSSVDKKGKNISIVDAKDNYNLRAAMIHVLSDILQSIGVLIAAFLIYFLGGDGGYNYWHLADPICTYLFSILVIVTTKGVSMDCLRVLMEGTPSEIDIQNFQKSILAIKNVVELHDLHIWQLAKGKPSLTCHIFVFEDPREVLKQTTKICREYGIYHSTLQIEEWDMKDTPHYIKCDHNIHY